MLLYQSDQKYMLTYVLKFDTLFYISKIHFVKLFFFLRE